MNKILLMELFFTGFICAKLVDIEVSKVKIRKIGIDDRKLYTLTGEVEYKNWDSCISDVAQLGIKVVCTLSDEEIGVSNFEDVYGDGSSVICGGQKISQNIKDKKNQIDEPKYYGCAIFANGNIVVYKMYEIWKFPVWGIVMIVLVILVFIAFISFLLYYRNKHPYNRVENKGDVQISLIDEDEKNAVINYGTNLNKDSDHIKVVETVKSKEENETNSELL